MIHTEYLVQLRRIGFTAAAMALAPLLAMACASASARQTRQHVGDETLPRPSVWLVYDFAVTADEVVADTFGSEFTSAAPATKELEQAHAVSRAFSKHLVSKLQERGIPAEPATPSTSIPLNAVAVKGQFMTVDAGSRLKRMAIGFGAGATELRVRAQIYQMTEAGLQRISEGEGQAKGDRMPGMAGPVAVGGVAGRVGQSVVISGGMNFAQEIKGGLHADAERLAEKAAERAAEFHERQGWR